MTFTKPVKLIAIADFKSEIEKYFPGVAFKFGKMSSTGNYVARFTEENWEFEILAEPKYKSDKLERWLIMGGVYGAQGRTLIELLANLKMVLDWKPSDYKNITKVWLQQFPLVECIKADPIPQEWKPSKEDYELVRDALKKEYEWKKGYLPSDTYMVKFDHNHKIEFKGLDSPKYSRPVSLEVPVKSIDGQKFNLVVITNENRSFITARH